MNRQFPKVGVVALCLVVFTAQVFGQSAMQSSNAGVRLEAGIAKEEADGDLKASTVYQQIAGDASAPRAVRAKALLRLGRCDEKLGQQARQVYEQIVRDYADQPVAVQARTRLAALSQQQSPGLRLVAGYTQLTHDGAEKSLIGIGGDSLFFQKGPDTLRMGLLDGVEQTIEVAGQGTLNVSSDGKALLWRKPSSAPVVESQLWLAPVSGQPPQALSKAVGHDGGWSRDGKSLIYAHGTMLYLGGNDGDHVKQIAVLPGIARHFSWSPDDRQVRFDLLDENSVSRTLWQIDITDYKSKALLDLKKRAADACCGHWTADGAYFVFEAAGQIWKLDEKHPENKPVQLTFSPMSLSTPVPGANPQQLFAVGKVLRGELLKYDQDGKKWVSFLNGISAEFVDVSPDEAVSTILCKRFRTSSSLSES